jgi:hemoglobin-like flavoprotein
MSPEQLALVQASFATLLPQLGLLADLFYFRLFALDPSLRRLFARDMRKQKHAFASMLQTMIGGLDQYETLRPLVEQLGQRHVQYGVRDEDYATVEQALLWALEQGLDDLAPPTRAAWVAAYRLLAATMQAAGAAIRSGDQVATSRDDR